MDASYLPNWFQVMSGMVLVYYFSDGYLQPAKASSTGFGKALVNLSREQIVYSHSLHLGAYWYSSYELSQNGLSLVFGSSVLRDCLFEKRNMTTPHHNTTQTQPTHRWLNKGVLQAVATIVDFHQL